MTLSALSNHVARAEDAAPEPAAAPEDLPRLVRRLRPSVVAITTSDAAGKPLSIGSGFVVGDGRSVLTNYHVITGASSAVVKLHDGRTIAVDGSFAADPDVDLAVLCVPPLGVPPLKIARGPLPDPGTQVLVIGSPLGLDGTVTDGLVSAVREAENRLQISAPISPGSSGSPVFSFRGEVLGVAVSVVEDAQAPNFAIPAASALRLLASAGSEVRPLDFSESERRWARFLADCDTALASAKFKRALYALSLVDGDPLAKDSPFVRIAVRNRFAVIDDRVARRFAELRDDGRPVAERAVAIRALHGECGQRLSFGTIPTFRIMGDWLAKFDAAVSPAPTRSDRIKDNVDELGQLPPALSRARAAAARNDYGEVLRIAQAHLDEASNPAPVVAAASRLERIAIDRSERRKWKIQDRWRLGDQVGAYHQILAFVVDFHGTSIESPLREWAERVRADLVARRVIRER